MSYAYAPEVLRQLADHGIRPTHQTAPARVRECLNDLYRYEIRRLRARLVRGEIVRPDYAGHVIALRQRYWLLSLPVASWIRPEDLS